MIADILKLSQTAVLRDIDYLREQARQNMQTHLQDKLPEEFSNCLSGINQVLTMAWNIANGITGGHNNGDSNINSDNSWTEERVDERTKLQALALVNDCYKYTMDLVTNGIFITHAIKFVQQKKEEVSKVNEDIEKLDTSILPRAAKKDQTTSESESARTSNQVF